MPQDHGGVPPPHDSPRRIYTGPVQMSQGSLRSVKRDTSSVMARSVQAVFGFRKTSLSLLSLLTILLVFLSAPWARDRALTLPEKEPFILAKAWLDLQAISRKPHTYISRANDEVHDYLLQRVQELSNGSKHISVSDDADSGVHLFGIKRSWWNASAAYSPLHYFESNNILVKITGSQPELEGVLLSAHYDSVPTAYGTTDDGAGVASMLGVLEHFARTKKQPKRTIVFNFNDNEEFGLFGAETFFLHPWSKLVRYFINLEGTGTGERAILFRTTDYAVAKFYAHVRSPFANSIYQQGFASGLVHSETDWRVYAQRGLRGFDIAFYKPRSLYHTAADSIKSSSKNALWHMLSNTLDLTLSLAGAEEIGSDTQTQAVFFDILGLSFMVVPNTGLYKTNLVLLIVAPAILALFGVIIKRRGTWKTGLGWVALPVTSTVAATAAKLMAHTISSTNPFIVSRDFTTPLIAVAGVFLFVSYVILTVFNSLVLIRDLKLIIIIEIYCLLWLVLLGVTVKQNTVASKVHTGEYAVSVVYACYSSAAIIGLLGIALSSFKVKGGKRPTNKLPNNRANAFQESINSHSSQETDPLLNDTEDGVGATTEDDAHEDTEDRARVATDNEGFAIGDNEHLDAFLDLSAENAYSNNFKGISSTQFDWSVQYLIIVPVSLLVIYSSVHLVLEGINQTIQESLQSQHFVYLVIFISAIALGMPFLSFAYKFNYLFGLILAVTVFVSAVISMAKEPFSGSSPLSMRVAQTINLDSSPSLPMVEVYGRQGTVAKVLGDLPSVKRNNITIDCVPGNDGMELCRYEGEKPYLVDGSLKDNSFKNYLNVTVIKSGGEGNPSPYQPLTAELAINAVENRFCQVVFNTTTFKSGEGGRSPVRMFTYYHDKEKSGRAGDDGAPEGGDGVLKAGDGAPKSADGAPNSKVAMGIPSGASEDSAGNEVFKWLSGIDEIHLHKLNWSQSSYHIGLQWIPKWLENGEEQEPRDSPNNRLGVTISCYWGEYDTVSIVDGKPIRKIPALDELMQYTPRERSVKNKYEGLVKIQRTITL